MCGMAQKPGARATAAWPNLRKPHGSPCMGQVLLKSIKHSLWDAVRMCFAKVTPPRGGGTHLSISLHCPLWEGLSSTWVTPTQVPSTSCVPKRLPPGWRGHPSGPTPPTKLQGLAETPAPHPRARRSERRGRAIPDKNKEARKGVFLLGNNTSQKLHGEAKTTPRPKPPERVWALYNDSPTPSTSDDN